MAYQEAGEDRSHDLYSPSASSFGMDDACLNSQNTDTKYKGCRRGNGRSPVVRVRDPVGCSWMREFTYDAVFANYTPPVQDRKSLGELQINVD